MKPNLRHSAVVLGLVGWITPAWAVAPLERTDTVELSPNQCVEIAERANGLLGQGQAEQAATILEDLLTRSQYRGVRESNALRVGPIVGFSACRNALYYQLGRAYYSQNRDELARRSYEHVSTESSWGRLARLEQAWTHLRLQEPELAEKSASQIVFEEKERGTPLHVEYELLRAFLALEKKRFDQALEIIRPLKPVARTLVSLRSRMIAQAEFQSYVKRYNDLAFKEKVGALERTLEALRSVDRNEIDSEFASLAAEAHWHIASVLRMENPIEYQKRALQELRHADDWLKPYVEKALTTGESSLSESAFFLSVALLWEQDRKSETVPRMLAMAQNFPQGEFLQDTHQLLADHFFDLGDFPKAIGFYRRLAEVGSEDKAAYGVYKAGWAFYNMDRKFAALRHLERVVLFHRQQGAYNEKQLQTEGESGLKKESLRDMLLILAEVLGFKDARSELEYLGFSAQDPVGLLVTEQLGRAYKDVGKYEDSILVWEDLLERQPSHDRTVEWLKNLIVVQLSAGRRDLLSRSLDRHGPKIKSGAATEDIEKTLGGVLLTVHREARKSEDVEIWKATDALYDSFLKFFPTTAEADVWYFGAQRKEQLGQFWKAMEWYQRSADLSKPESAKESAVSLLRILKTSPKPNQPAKRLAYAEWFLSKFQKGEEAKLASFIAIESGFELGDLERVSGFLFDRSDSPFFQDLYLAHNKRLYGAKNWTEVHRLATVALQKSPGPEFQILLRTFQQEAAFEFAFTRPKTDWKLAREWYQKSVADPVDEKVALKAWTNLFLTFRAEDSAEDLAQRMTLFESGREGAQPLTRPEDRILLRSVYQAAAQAAAAVGDVLHRSAWLSASAEFEPDASKAFQTRYESVVTLGVYGDPTSFHKSWDQLRAKSGALLQDPKALAALIRLDVWSRELNHAWRMLKPLLAGPPSSVYAPYWIVFSDLMRMSVLSEHPVRAELQVWLGQERSRLKEVQVLWPWTRGRELGSLQAGGKSAELSFRPARAGDFKDRVAVVGQSLETAQAAEEKVGQDSCRLAQIKTATRVQLDSLQTPALATPQWPAFLKKLQEKIREVRLEETKEASLCSENRKTLAFFRPGERAPKPKGRLERDEAGGKVLILEADLETRGASTWKVMSELISRGGWAAAERFAFSRTQASERTVLLGYLRYRWGDWWNAASLFRGVSDEGKDRQAARVFLARIAEELEAPEVARAELQGVKRALIPSDLDSEWSEVRKLVEP